MENEEISASVRIEVRVPNDYPSSSPFVSLSNPRGISEKDFNELCRNVQDIVANRDTSPVICEIFQNCCDFLTERQCETDISCAICLERISHFPIFVTSCDHFLHSDCFLVHISYVVREIREAIEEAQPLLKNEVNKMIYCPICRTPLTPGEDLEKEVDELNAEARKHAKVMTEMSGRRNSSTMRDLEDYLKRWREEQNRLKDIYEIQKLRGGIIDPEEERRNYLFIDARSNS